MPMRFRGIGAPHLHTSSADFNRRLQTYLTTQMAMRQTNQLFAEQFPNVPQFAQNQQSLYQQSLMAQQFQQQMMMQQQQQQQQQFMQSPRSPTGSYRQTPYPTANMQQSGFQLNPVPGRSASIATPQASASNRNSHSPLIKTETPTRRMSLNSINPSIKSEITASMSSPTSTSSPPFPVVPSSQQQQNQFSQFLPSAPFSTYANSSNNYHYKGDSFLDFNLPTESQQLLGGDPTGSLFMMNNNNSFMPAPYFATGEMEPVDKKNNFSSNNNPAREQGLNMTLALDDTAENFGPAYTSTSFSNDFSSGPKESGYGSTSGTPGGIDFDLFINGQDHWSQTPNSSQ